MSVSNRRRAVITGMGAVTPLGFGTAALWDGVRAGRSGIRRITAFDLADYKAHNGAEVDSAALGERLKARRVATGDRGVDMTVLAAAEALAEAGLRTGEGPHPRSPVAAIVGTGIGANHAWFECSAAFAEKGVRGMRPTSVPRSMGNAYSAQLSLLFGLTGPNYAVVSACTSGTTAIGTAFRMVRDGYAAQALCGGGDAVFDPFVYAGWNNLGVMSKCPDPAAACRPFDAARDGCVLGEGAAMLLLESLDSALARGAAIRGEILGFGESSDAGHITRPDPEGQAAAIRAALADAGVGAAALGYVNAHGTATRANDASEARALQLALGDRADRVPAGSTKSMIGHLLGASGAAETIVTLRALEAGVVPPNVNLDTPDPECGICLAGSTAAPMAAPVAIKNSFGFGGNNAVLVLARFER